MHSKAGEVLLDFEEDSPILSWWGCWVLQKPASDHYDPSIYSHSTKTNGVDKVEN